MLVIFRNRPLITIELQPILKHQISHIYQACEVPQVVRCQGQLVGDSEAGDLQIQVADYVLEFLYAMQPEELPALDA